MPYKVLDIYADLPKTNCGECRKKACYPFAVGVFLEGLKLSECPHLDDEKRQEMQKRLNEEKGIGGSGKAAASEKALEFLLEKLKTSDFKLLARRCGGEWIDEPSEAIRLPFLGRNYRIEREDVRAEEGEQPSVFIKILLMIYATRSSDAEVLDKWTAFRELPNSTSKAKSFEDNAGRIAGLFGEDLDGLDEAVLRWGGLPASESSADRAYRFQALPKVELLLLFWKGDEDFEARTSILLNANVLDFLDQEAITFLSEALVNALMGEDINDIAP